MVSPMGNFFTLHVITVRGASVREREERVKRTGENEICLLCARAERRSSLIKSRWPNDESSSGSRLEGETGATMGNEGWTETVADGESVVMVAGCEGEEAGGRGNTTCRDEDQEGNGGWDARERYRPCRMRCRRVADVFGDASHNGLFLCKDVHQRFDLHRRKYARACNSDV